MIVVKKNGKRWLPVSKADRLLADVHQLTFIIKVVVVDVVIVWLVLRHLPEIFSA